MKRATYMLGALAVAAAGFLFAAPANANSVSCTNITISGAGYPADGANLKNCMRHPGTDQSEATRQNQIINSVNGAAHILNTTKRNQIKNKDVIYYIFSNGQDAIDTLGLQTQSPKPTETGRSWTIPNSVENPNVPFPIITIWEYTVQQWNNGNPITTGYQYSQTGGTAEHEEGHHFDRIWAQLLSYQDIPNPPQSPIPATMTNADAAWLSAYQKDLAHLSTTAQNIINAQSPRLNNSAELFAVEFGSRAGGGLGPVINLGGGNTVSEGQFVKDNFPCTTYYMLRIYLANGTPPSAPAPSACFGASSW